MLCMNFGDTNFIGIVNAEKYSSFVNEDWEFEELLQHFEGEMKKGHILVSQMTNEGIEHSWKVDIKFSTQEVSTKCFRKAVGYMKVTDEQLYLIDYDCLTMAAQFENHKVPDENCMKHKINIENGIYKVEFIQFYDVDNNRYLGANDKDILLNFLKVDDFQIVNNRVFWCNLY